MEFTADQVWACAVAADRINDGYIKEDVWAEVSGEQRKIKEANKLLVKRWLREGDFSQLTEADYAAGRIARDHFKSYTLLALRGDLNDFQSTAMKIAAMDQFTGRNMYEFAVVSCLPSVAQRDTARTELKREIYASEQLVGNIGDQVTGDISVVSTKFNPEFNKWRITARMGESYVDFWFSRELKGECRIKGKIKFLRDNKTTALNYVKVL